LGQLVNPICKAQEIQKILDFVIPENGANSLSGIVGKELPLHAA
jgi:hypothetical protein